VREQIVAAIIRFDEAEALGVVKPFHSASRHVFSLLKGLSKSLLRPRSSPGGLNKAKSL
jgi:hypothetical protein